MTITATFEEKPILANKKTICFHCGENCPEEPVLLAAKSFCCEGCKTVFEILDANDLCNFYNIERNAGLSQKGKKQAQYAWLDDPEAAEKLVDFTDGRTTKVTFYLPQIHCASCVWLVENLYKLAPGITASKVNFLKKEASVIFNNEQISLRKVAELLASVGYTPDLNLGSPDRAQRRPVSRRLIIQLGVAGFAFGNIMLLSFPEYIGLEAGEMWFRRLFGYINILLATPVAFYSGRDYITGAWHSLRTRNFGIDIPLGLGILVLYFRSVFEILTDSGAGYMDSLAGLVFFLLIGKWFQQITYHRISFERDYRSYFPMAVTRLSKSQRLEKPVVEEENVTINKLEPGDTILIRRHEIIPADGILKKGNARIDYSFVTGEAEPVERHSGDKIYAGGRQTCEAIELLVTKKMSQSYLTQLWNDDAFQHDKSGGASRLANSVSSYFTAIILLIAFASLAYWLPKDSRTAFNAFTAVLIIACPCAAALNVPFTLGNAVRLMARRGFFLKNTNVAEALRHVSTVVFDKTGTLTHASGSNLLFEGEALSDLEKRWFSALARQSAHPLSRQLFNWLGGQDEKLLVIDYQEITGQGISCIVDGHRLRIGSKFFLKSENAAPGATMLIELNGKLRGSFTLRNQYREYAWEVLEWFQQRSKTYLLSGDNERERAFLATKFQAGEQSVFFHQSPQDKLNFIKKLQSGGEKIIMLGDGLNDAGALAQSDVGIVIAEDANNFTPACDAILDARQFAQLPRFLDFIKYSIYLVYAAWTLAAMYNVVGLSFAVQGKLSPVVAAILMPASSLTIVAFGVGATTLLAREFLPGVKS